MCFLSENYLLNTYRVPIDTYSTFYLFIFTKIAINIKNIIIWKCDMQKSKAVEIEVNKRRIPKL